VCGRVYFRREDAPLLPLLSSGSAIWGKAANQCWHHYRKVHFQSVTQITIFLSLPKMVLRRARPLSTNQCPLVAGSRKNEQK
jgi:hypothetical protein